jgi:murein DD-endopeptidase MepM/ murein hydrolase activator NlpD
LLYALALAAAAQPARAQDSAGTPPTRGVTIHVVQYGETLERIAAAYEISSDALREANALPATAQIAVGQRLLIPASPGMLATSTQQQVVVVGLGDTLYALAERHGLSVEQLGATNLVASPGQLYAGQSLTVPTSGQPDPANLIRITTDESLWQVALRHNTSLAALMLLNHVADPLAVPEGRLLALPAGSEPGTALFGPWVSLILHPLPLEQGRTGGLRVQTAAPGVLAVSFLAREWPVISEGTMHYVLIAIDRWTAPGLYPLSVTFTDGSGSVWSFTRPVQIASGEYQREEIRLSDEVAAVLNDSDIVRGESAYIQQMMSGFTPEKLWDGLFVLPAAGVLTSGFGTARSYNGAGFNSFHAGADLAAPTGTPIYAPAGGVVVDTGLLDVRGYITIIDHGWGVYTGYWHQSSILVRPGDTVTAGQQIGTVGSTGLSTAAHLHWEMWVAGTQVDPMQWVRAVFP